MVRVLQGRKAEARSRRSVTGCITSAAPYSCAVEDGLYAATLAQRFLGRAVDEGKTP